MDPGGLGAIIGIGAMVCIYVSWKINDMYESRKQKTQLTVRSPLLPPPIPSKQVHALKVTHVKMNKILPPVSGVKNIPLSNLSSMTGSRNLFTSYNLKI